MGSFEIVEQEGFKTCGTCINVRKKKEKRYRKEMPLCLLKNCI